MLLSRSNLYLSNTGCVFREVSSLCRYFVSLTFKVCLEKFKSVFAYVRRVGDNRLTELHHDRYMYAYTLRSALSVFPLARLPPHLLYSLTSVHLATGSSPVRGVQCVDRTEGVLSQSAIRRSQTSQPYWPLHTGQPQCV